VTVSIADLSLDDRVSKRSTPPLNPPSEGEQIEKILSARKVLENRYFVSRYPQIHYYLLYFAVRTSDQT